MTDWDEFVGRFEAIQQVQIRARVGGFVDSVDFKDGAIVKAGDLLYVIDPRPYAAALLTAQGQLADARAKVDLAERELAERGSSTGPRPCLMPWSTSAGSSRKQRKRRSSKPTER